VLILGAGDIGARIATAVRPFDAVPTLVGRRTRDGVIGMDGVPALLSRQHAVVVALPATSQTRGLVDADFLAALPDGAVVANVARGPIVDTAALLAETRSGRLRAYLDVTDPEPLPPEHPLWSLPNVLITPHVGGGAQRWQERAYALVGQQVYRYLRGEALVNVVDVSTLS
jgi:phosphoglycerate dehydrogenase-like enzyme